MLQKFFNSTAVRFETVIDWLKYIGNNLCNLPSSLKKKLVLATNKCSKFSAYCLT